MDTELLAILSCPNTRTPLHLLSRKRLEQLNRAIAAGKIANINHQPLTRTLSTALISGDNKLIYPVVEGKPQLNPDQAIATLQLENF